MSLTLQDDWKILNKYNYSIQNIIGVDEAGRGPLAGPLVVAGVCFSHDVSINEIRDSKKISEEKRIYLSDIIKEKAKCYHIEIVNLDMIEKMNIYQASKWGMIKCFHMIQQNIGVNILLTDAMKITKEELNSITIPIIKGDNKSFHIAAASILAKTTRDSIMKRLHNEFPEYEWNKNKGYPTQRHRESIKKYGICKYHRKKFKLY